MNILSENEVKRIIIVSYYQSEKSKNKLLSSIKSFIMCVTQKAEVIGELNGILFFNSVNRESHRSLFKAILESCENEKNEIEISYKNTLYLRGFKSIIGALSYFNCVTTILSKELSGSRWTFCEKLYIASELAKYINLKNQIRNYSFSGVKMLVVLSDVLFEEYAIVNYLNSINIDTVSCQHGIYVPEEKILSVDQLNYMDAPAKSMLVWGESTSMLYKKFSPDCKCFICGNPILEKSKGNGCHKVVGVVLDVPRFRNINQKLVDFAEGYALKNGMAIQVRIHPADIEKNYSINKNITVFDKNMNEAKFILVHTSTMMYELMAQGRKVFKLKTETPCLLNNKEIQFTNVLELDELALNMNNINFEKILEEHISIMGKQSRLKYALFFKKSLKNC